MTMVETEPEQAAPHLPATRWLWLLTHAIGLGSILAFVVQGVRHQNCQLGLIIANGDWGPFAGSEYPTADDLGERLALAYLVIPPINIVVTLLHRIARIGRFEWIVVAHIVANAVVWLGMVSLIVVTGGMQVDHAVFCSSGSFIWLGVFTVPIAVGAWVVNVPPKRLHDRLYAGERTQP